MYCVFRNRGQGVVFLGRFLKKLKCILLNNFYAFGPISLKLIPQMVALKKWYTHGQWVDVSCIQESG